MKTIIRLFLLLIIARNPILSQGNTTPCSALIVCPNQTIFGTPDPLGLFQTNIPANQICHDLSSRPTLFYKVIINSPGVFTFLIRPGTDSDNSGLVDDPSEVAPVDYDWAVWLNGNCQNLSTTAPVRLSWVTPGSGIPFITGLNANVTNLTCEAAFVTANQTGLLSGIPVNAGDQLIIAVNYYSFPSAIVPFQLVIGGANGGGGSVGFVGYQYDLSDKSGTVRKVFCIGEEVILRGFGATSSNFKIDLLPENSETPLVSKDIVSASVDGLNITDVFSGYSFATGVNYRVKLTVNGPCGCMEIIQPFSFICCDGSIDPSFSLSGEENPKLSGVSSVPGSHLWEVFSVSPYTGNLLSDKPLEVSREAQLSINRDGPCYFVKHSVTNSCGNSCTAQRFCKFTCEDKECNLSAPINLGIRNVNELYWDPVVGALSYVLVLNPCDPTCCGGPSNAPTSSGISISVPATSYNITPADFTGVQFEGIPCFSWKVYARCPDGTLSAASNPPQCFSSGVGSSCWSWQRAAQSNPLGNLTPIKENTEVELLPNPANGSLLIDIKSNKDITYAIKIYDNTGGLVKNFEEQHTTDKKGNVKWNVEDLGKGIYLIKIATSDNQLVTKKLIVE